MALCDYDRMAVLVSQNWHNPMGLIDVILKK